MYFSFSILSVPVDSIKNINYKMLLSQMVLQIGNKGPTSMLLTLFAGYQIGDNCPWISIFGPLNIIHAPLHFHYEAVQFIDASSITCKGVHCNRRNSKIHSSCPFHSLFLFTLSDSRGL